MTEPVKAKGEFADVPEDAVWDALNDPDPDNPVAAEVGRLIEGYTSNFQTHVEELGHIPPTILRSKGGCPIEEIAMRLTSDAIREAMEGDK